MNSFHIDNKHIIFILLNQVNYSTVKTVLIYLAIFVIALTGMYLFVFDVNNYEELPFIQRYSSEMVLNSFEEIIKSVPEKERAIIDYDFLMGGLSFFERNFAFNVLRIPPSDLGFKGPFYSFSKPGKLVKLESVKLVSGRETGIQYLPKHIYDDYLKMMEKMKENIGKRLYVDSGYRSLGMQAYLFFYYLVKSNKFSLRENAKWIALPGYSEHGHPVNTAIDFTSIEGINGFNDGQTADDFIELPEYKWLLENAAAFNFYLTYPSDNKYGVAFEPWHWHWEKK